MNTMLIILCMIVLAYDMLYRRVPNKLLLIALVVHAGLLIVTGHGFTGIDVLQSVKGGVTGFAVFLPLYLLRAMGAGDVKFFTLLGFLIGIKYLAITWLVASVMAGIHAALWYALRNGMGSQIPELNQLFLKLSGSTPYQKMMTRRSGRKGIPYAGYLAVAALIATT